MTHVNREDYTSGTAGIRVWRIGTKQHIYLTDTDFITTIYRTDTFEVTKINDSVVNVKGIDLSFSLKDTVNGYIEFENSQHVAHFYNLYYYYHADSMHYHSDFSHATGYDVLDYDTP